MEFSKTGEKGEYIILEGSDGSKFEAEFIELMRYEGDEYAALLQPGDDMITLMRFVENAGGEHYYTIDEDAVFDAVFELFVKENGEEFGFEQ